MGTKTISITDEAYGLLARNKRTKESFSQEITRLMKKRGSILDLVGVGKALTEHEHHTMIETMAQVRKLGKYREMS